MDNIKKLKRQIVDKIHKLNDYHLLLIIAKLLNLKIFELCFIIIIIL